MIFEINSQHELERLESEHLLRRLRRQETLGPRRVVIDGREAVLFADNDYLGLATHPAVVAAAREALAEFGASASASRLISGNSSPHEELEGKLARLKGKEAALVFPSGYMANLAFLATAAGPQDTLFLDRLCHASLYDGWRLSGAALKRFRHNDPGHLEQLLLKSGDHGRRFIVTEGVFSMDGDLAPLRDLVALAGKFGCQLVVDDAHGTGVLGPDGKGTCAHLGIHANVEIGTLSKAAGSLGGFVAGSRSLIELLVNKARPFIFTTGLPPSAVAAASKAVSLLGEEDWRRKRVLQLAARARRQLAATGLDVPDGLTPILPVIAGRPELAVELSRICLERGVFIPAIRAPAVPAGSARLRMTVSAGHTNDEIDKAIETLTAAAEAVGLV